VFTTCPDQDTAERLARALVTEGVAACVNIVPIAQSVYFWKGSVESAAEVLLIIKSRVDRYADIQKRLVDMHPYELPEVIAVPVSEGLPRYLAWIQHPEKS